MDRLLEQIKDTQNLLQSTKEQLRHSPNDPVLLFALRQDEALLHSLYKQYLEKKLPQNSPKEILQEVYGTTLIRDLNPIKIADHYGIIVKRMSMIEGIGRSYFDGKHLYIFYQPTTPNRDKFTIAHELGHIFIHFKKGIKFEFNDREIFSPVNNTEYALSAARGLGGNTFYEQEANRFAAELLVSYDALKDFLDKIPAGMQTNTIALSQLFRVSEEMMYYTVKNYGFLNQGKVVRKEKKGWI